MNTRHQLTRFFISILVLTSLTAIWLSLTWSPQVDHNAAQTAVEIAFPVPAQAGHSLPAAGKTQANDRPDNSQPSEPADHRRDPDESPCQVKKNDRLFIVRRSCGHAWSG